MTDVPLHAPQIATVPPQANASPLKAEVEHVFSPVPVSVCQASDAMMNVNSVWTHQTRTFDWCPSVQTHAHLMEIASLASIAGRWVQISRMPVFLETKNAVAHGAAHGARAMSL